MSLAREKGSQSVTKWRILLQRPMMRCGARRWRRLKRDGSWGHSILNKSHLIIHWAEGMLCMWIQPWFNSCPCNFKLSALLTHSLITTVLFLILAIDVWFLRDCTACFNTCGGHVSRDCGCPACAAFWTNSSGVWYTPHFWTILSLAEFSRAALRTPPFTGAVMGEVTNLSILSTAPYPSLSGGAWKGVCAKCCRTKEFTMWRDLWMWWLGWWCVWRHFDCYDCCKLRNKWWQLGIGLYTRLGSNCLKKGFTWGCHVLQLAWWQLHPSLG